MRSMLFGLLGIAMTVGLFLLMHELISAGGDVNRDRNDILRLDFVQVDQDEIENIRERRKPREPDPPKEPPPPPKLNIEDQGRPQSQMPEIEMPQISIGVAGGAGPYLGSWSAGDPFA